jgi:hypothetical protein
MLGHCLCFMLFSFYMPPQESKPHLTLTEVVRVLDSCPPYIQLATAGEGSAETMAMKITDMYGQPSIFSSLK